MSVGYETDSLFETGEAYSGGGHIIRVAFEAGVDTEFDYLVPERLWPIGVGQRVKAPFGRRNKAEIGFCVESDISEDESFAGRGRGRRLKKISEAVDKEPLVNAELMELARWIGSYYVCPLGQVLAAMVPAAVKKGIGVKKEKYVYLTSGGEERSEQLRGKKQKQIVKLLKGRGAFDSGNAVELNGLLEEAGCTGAPIKKLAEKQIIKTVQRTAFKSLPVIDEEMLIRAGKIVLNDDQQKALGQIKGQMETGKFGVTLLHGVTDSGKTELYIRAIEACLQKGSGSIVMLPEIALTAQTVQRFGTRFERVAVMHSRLTAAQRNVQWQKIKAGKADVVIGARSAVFAPLPKVGLIVVDEEHEPSYKQDTAPRYHGRDVAIKRAQLANAHCIVGSATPSLGTLLNCSHKKHFNLVQLPKRVMDLAFPEMKLIDLREGYSVQKGVSLISEPLAERLKEALAKKEQAILLLNRRGYSNFVFCPSCKHTLHCRNCDVTLTFHKSKRQLYHGSERMATVTGRHINYGYAMCHHCGAQTLVPEKCALCGKGMAMIGLGSQRLEEELAERFPGACVKRVDSDSMQGKDYYRVLRDFGRGRIDILAGTQMLAKGLHFPNVTVVGIISADTSLYLPDFRANERTFQLVSQVAGRAGRSEKKGTVFVQTFLAEQPAIQFAVKGDFDGFIREELKHRRACNLPPFWRLAAIVMRDTKFDKLEAASENMRSNVDQIVEREGLKVIVRGPMPAVISRIQRYHRMQIIIQAPEAEIIMRLFTSLKTVGPVRPAVKVAIDIDPVNLI
ncbi:MAG: replication restart helicase PriA [Planctomycetota bacterium]|jgi:primosomal protein N' (replication factor Y)